MIVPQGMSSLNRDGPDGGTVSAGDFHRQGNELDDLRSDLIEIR
jgi:hypothetical protein